MEFIGPILSRCEKIGGTTVGLKATPETTHEGTKIEKDTPTVRSRHFKSRDILVRG